MGNRGLAWLLAAACGTPALGAAQVEHQTFYASFDRGLAADFARGQAQPLASGYCLKDAPGRRGRALAYSGRNVRHARVFYDAAGNLHSSRGTCMMWFKPDSDEGGKPYCRPVLLGLSTAVEGYWGCVMMWGPRMISGKTPMTRCYASVFDGGRGLHMASYKIEGLWRKGEWRHLALVWDARMGIRMYDSGRLVASKWGVDQGWAGVPHFPARHFSLGMHNHSFRGGGQSGYAIDEVRVFDAALDARTIAAFAEGRVDSGVALDPIPPQADARALERMGWAGPARGSLVPLLLSAEGHGATAIRVNAVDESVDERRPLSHLSDGLPTSGWPHPTYGTSASGREVDLKLREPGRFNRIEIDAFKGFEGAFVPTAGDLALGKAAIRLAEDRVIWRCRLARAVTAKRLRIHREGGRAAAVRLWEVLPDAAELGLSEPTRRYVPVGDIHTEPIRRSLAGRCARQSAPGPLIGWRLAEGSAPAGAPSIRLPALTPACVVSDEVTEDLAVAGVTLRLRVASAPPGAVVRLELRDPIWPTRRLFQGDFRLQSGPGGTGTVTIDLPDFFVAGRKPGEPFPAEGKDVSAWQARQPLRLVAVMTVSHGMTLEGLELALHEADRTAAIAEHNREQLSYIREGYADTSESRAYGWHPLAYEKLFYPLYDFNLREPERPEVRAIATRVGLCKEPLKPAMPKPEAGVPRWASLQLDLLRRCRALCHYWIDERELPNGEVGGGLGDDTDFKDDWVNLALISDDDGKIAASVRRLADTAWTRDGMDNGYQLWWRDALHAVEEGASLQPHLLYLYPGDPVGIERSMLLCRHLEHWMGATPTGKLHFKSWFVGGKGRMRTDFRYGEDRPTCGLFLIMPSQYVWRTGHPAVAERIVKWCDSWLSYLDDTDDQGHALGLPSAVEWKTGRVVGKRIRPDRGETGVTRMLVPFVCAYRHTGHERYLALHRLLAAGLSHARTPHLGSWAAELARLGSDADRALLAPVVLKLAHKRIEDVPSVRRDPSYARSQLLPQYVAWQLTGDVGYLEVGLACARSFLEEQMPALTWALPSTDRIPQPRETLDQMYLGGLATLRPGYGPPYPGHAVSYRGLGESVAALVTMNQPQRLSVTLFNTDPKPREITMRLWQIQPGRYTLQRGPDAQDVALERGDPVQVTLPPRVTYVVDLKALDAKPAPRSPRPDLAVAAAEVKKDLNAGHAIVLVHNVGLAPARDVLVRLVDSKTGAAMDEQTIPRLDAPLDLNPRLARLQFPNVDTAPHGRLRVVVDPENAIDEADERNNTAEFAF